MLHKNQTELQDFNEAVQYEWLETNGLGGWCGSSLIGCNTRRYHGLLVAAIVPPTERMMMLSKLDETILVGNDRFELATNDYGQVTYPEGYKNQLSFTKALFPEFTYAVGNGINIKKTIAMVHGENTVVIKYDVITAGQTFILELLPLFAVRGYHSLMHANDSVNREFSFENDIFKTKVYNETPDIFIKIAGSSFHANSDWYYNFNYKVEQNRGLDYVEDLFSYGLFHVDLKEGDSLGIVISTDNPANKDPHQLLKGERLRRQALLKEQPLDETLQQLVLAADQFIVKRGENLKSVIAGYHWFTDWGRDTMISLPGLTLSTKRFEDARKIITVFAESVSMGMLPNRFQDYGEQPAYNSVDATLWYFIAIYKYLQATGDKPFVLNEILPRLKDIIEWHFRGTRFNIHVEDDGLLFAGEEGQQLTWMDAKIGEYVVTPRIGKPVEIQALWYNALKIYAELLEMNGQTSDASKFNINAEKVKQNFINKFWNEEGNYLHDVLDKHDNPVREFRPNQLFAISLPFALIEGERAKALLELIENQLYTPVGLKSLSKSDLHYLPEYGGDTYQRDAAYHQGTVWSWLLGPFVDALCKFDGSTSKARAVIAQFKYHLNEACIGTVSEIFDAEPPHLPKGCVAQAWGVAEILRVIKDYQLYKEVTPSNQKGLEVL